MMQWKRLFNMDGQDRRGTWHDEFQSLLPTSRHDNYPSAIPAKDVTRVALRLKYQVEAVIPCQLEESKITAPHSPIITPGVVKTAKSAGGEEHKGCVVYCLLVCRKWFKRQASIELWDAEMHDVRATACEVLAKQIIEGEEDQRYLLEEVLLKRYSILVNGNDSAPSNVIERAVDLHALRVISSSGYQKCINYLWRGWLVQDEDDPSRFIEYKEKINTSYWAHVDPDRMRAPKYQNAVQVGMSIIFLALYTGAINSINPTGDLDPIEGLLYVFTLGFICDEVAKFWKVGWFYIGFWNIFNSTLYALLTVSFTTRMIALGHRVGNEERRHFNQLSYNFLAFSAPMFWMRLLLYLDSFRFFGAMLVIIRVMMKESIIFFALLIFVIIGFLQAFYGMDQVDQEVDAVSFIIRAMTDVVMGSPNFGGFDNYSPPFGTILYYIYSFLVMVILLNILIALYNSAYSDVTEDAIDEYLALFAQKTLRFVRAPDENVYIAPFNLIEIFLLVLPFEWWLSKQSYERLNDHVMGLIYSPVLFITAYFETREAFAVKSNRRRGEQDDDTVEEWEEMQGEVDFEAEGWTKSVERTRPNVEVDGTLVEIRALRRDVEVVRGMVEGLRGGGRDGEGGGRGVEW